MATDRRDRESELEELVRSLIEEIETPDLELSDAEEMEEGHKSPAENALRQFREEYSKRVRAAHSS